jgi:hypothetical protein
MEGSEQLLTNDNKKGGISLPKILLIVLITVLVTLGGSYWFLKTYVFAREFKPVKLSEKEQRVVDSKLRTLGFQPGESRIETNSMGAAPSSRNAIAKRVQNARSASMSAS